VYMFHCHNLIHEDHDMMAAFNVTSLVDWGYPETTKFIDPMEQKYRSKDINDHDEEKEHILEMCAEFEALEAYVDPQKMEDSLAEYWANGGPKAPTTLAISTRATSSSVARSFTQQVTTSSGSAVRVASSVVVTSASRSASTSKSSSTRTTSSSIRSR
jgi:bilirubin oxidase